MSMLLLLAASTIGGAAIVTLTNTTIADEPPSGNAYSSIIFRADGTLDKDGSLSGVTQIRVATDWVIPNLKNSGYEVRLLSGHGGTTFNVEAAAEDTWVDLSADRTWRHDRVTSGTDTGTYTFEIRLGSAGAAIETGDFVVTATKV